MADQKRRKRRGALASRIKCPQCWAEKAYRRKVNGWRRLLYHCLLLAPMKCYHCYHKFSVFWFATIGKQLEPPPHLLRVSEVTRLSHAARHSVGINPADHAPAHPRRTLRRDAA